MPPKTKSTKKPKAPGSSASSVASTPSKKSAKSPGGSAKNGRPKSPPKGANGKGRPKSPGKGKKKKPVAEKPTEETAPPPPKIDNSLYRYLCCFCCFKYKSRKLTRAREKELQAAEEAAKLAEYLRQQELLNQPTVEEISHEVESNKRKNTSAIKIQSMIRGFLGRVAAKLKLEEVLREVNDYWLEIKRQRDYAAWLKQMEIEARRQVSIYGCGGGALLHAVS